VLYLSLYERRCIYSSQQTLLAPFLKKVSLDREPQGGLQIS